MFLVTQLSSGQIQRRQQGHYQRKFIYEEKHNHRRIPSYMKFIYQNLLVNLSERLKVDETILDFNYLRLQHLIHQCLRYGQTSSEIYTNSIKYQTKAFHMHEWPIALEIFLQIDGQSHKREKEKNSLFS